jgi:hypothetical protein
MMIFSNLDAWNAFEQNSHTTQMFATPTVSRHSHQRKLLHPKILASNDLKTEQEENENNSFQHLSNKMASSIEPVNLPKKHENQSHKNVNQLQTLLDKDSDIQKMQNHQCA